MFIVQPDQNTNSVTKLHEYPGLTHFTNTILNHLEHSTPSQQGFDPDIILGDSGTEYQKYFF